MDDFVGDVEGAGGFGESEGDRGEIEVETEFVFDFEAFLVGFAAKMKKIQIRG